ncbi:CAP domain-containing protein [Robertmurraya sp. FSL W8-0741]|uniref:CAP domain-containing protein n=1 Tax=Robertmurraya sp. FSL W8-0741 TaxID=2954629 RepID=UPI0030FD025D
MKKKFIIPIAASAALLFTSASAINANAATIETKHVKNITIYQQGNLKKEQLNRLLNKYLQKSQINFQLNQKQPTKNNQTVTTDKPVSTKPAPAQQQTPKKPETSEQKPTMSNTQASAFEQKVVDLTNEERSKNGLPALKIDENLSKVARAKSEDMKTMGYFSHTSPNYGSPFDMMKRFGITYRSAGENIAMGQRSPEEVVQAWMNSEGHRANILNSSFTHIGVGYVANGNYWTQMFISK